MAKDVIYQLYLPSFGNDGLVKIRRKGIPDWIRTVGATHVWLSGALSSPGYDHGYDVDNFCRINTSFGSMKDLFDLTNEIHNCGMRVIIDLVLNHTSVEHEWFTSHPEYYCHKSRPVEGWRNLFDEGPVWAEDKINGGYYLHLFHEKQADLNWFPDGSSDPNPELVNEFKKIVSFWLQYGVDGFRLDVPQSINKNLGWPTLVFSDLLHGDKAVKVINSIFSSEDEFKTSEGKKPFLLMECFDPTSDGEIIDYYSDNAPVIDRIANVLIKDSLRNGEIRAFKNKLRVFAKKPKFILDLESHDSPRIVSAAKLPAPYIRDHLFLDPKVNAIIIYQGQEFGLLNPVRSQMSDADMLRLDAQTAMRYAQGHSLNELRPTSRANARVDIQNHYVDGRRRWGSTLAFLSAVNTWKFPDTWGKK